MGHPAKILIYDIETAPIIGTIWQRYEADMIWSIQDWYILCFAYKWYGDKKTYVVAQDDFKGYKPGSPDDSEVIKVLHGLFNEASMVVAHNGDAFDQKKSHSRFIINGLEPPSPYLQIDTKKVAKRYFNFTSNKLDDLGDYLGFGKKMKTDASLWRGCMAGDKKSWKYMKQYNKRDVELLEKIYIKMRPWMNNHPHMGLYGGNLTACPKCGKGPLHAKGVQVSRVAKFQRWQCQNCGGYSRDRLGNAITERPKVV